MDYSVDIVIKEEPNFEYKHNRNILEIDHEIKVKVEDCSLLEEDWCVENRILFEEIDKQLEQKQYECQLCEQRFIDSHSLLKHNVQHLRIMVAKCIAYQCNTCSCYFTKKENLKAHIQEQHIEMNKHRTKRNALMTKSKHQCHVCGKVLPYKSWHEHVRQVHSDERIPCVKCGKHFKCSRTLRRHVMYVHDGVKAAWRSNVYKSNMGEVACSVCKKSFCNNSSMKAHQRNCHSGREYQCYICKSTLKSKSYLMTHMNRVHYFDGKEHSCELCGKKFKSPRYLNVHKKNSHVRQRYAKNC